MVWLDVERKVELVSRPPTVEVITPEELRMLFETKEHPIAYNGFEPSGLVHLGTGLICAYKMKDLIEAGVRFKVYLACWHAWINDKLGGDMEKIRMAARHFVHSWIACGVPEDKLEVIWPEEEYDLNYWSRVIRIAKKLTLNRVIRTLEIAGRREVDVRSLAYLFYTPMQVSDIFEFEVDICQLGLDQRKANVVAREVGPSLGLWKPVCVHHHLLLGLGEPPVWPLPDNPKMRRELISQAKMSKSKPKTCIFIYDEPEVIRQKIRAAFCPPKDVEYNPILDIVKHIVFREFDSFEVERPAKYGGTIEFQSYGEVEEAYMDGSLHPLDLKNAVAEALIKILEPVRRYFKNKSEARRLLNFMLSTMG